MKTPNRYQLALFFTLLVVPMVNLLAGPMIEAVQQPEIDSSICVDTPPYNDGFGWNGTCGCLTEHTPGISLEFAEQDILLMSGRSPAACTGSNALFAYTKAEDEWKVSAELRSTHNQPHDNFPDNVTIAGDTIVATSGRFNDNQTAYPYITLFEKDAADTWTELQTIIVDSPVPEWRESVKFDGETLVFSYKLNDEYPIFVYEKSGDGFWYETARLSTTEPERTYQQYPLLRLDGNTLAALHTSNPKVIFFEKINGQWIEQSTLSLPDYSSGNVSSNYSFENGLLIVGLTSYEKQSNGAWVERPRDTRFGHLTLIPQTLLPYGDLSFDIRRLLPSNPEEPCFGCGVDLSPGITSYRLVNGNWVTVDRIYLNDMERVFQSQLVQYGQNVSFFYDNNLFVYSLDADGYFNGGEAEGRAGNNSITSNGCDYTNAPQHDGWGWNATTGTSCAPLSQSNESSMNEQTILIPDNTSGCDYSNAAQYGGWGWNPNTSTSCPPVSSVVSTNTAINPLIFDAVSSNPLVLTVTPEITGQCVDVVPFNDNWGWNGTCSCELTYNPIYEEFGSHINMRNNTLFINSDSSPQACYGSGSVLVYSLDDTGQLRREAELLPAARSRGDGFAGWVLKDHHITDDLVAPYTWQTVTVFGREGGSWTELYTKDRESGHAFFDDELITTSSAGIKRYDAGTGQLKSTFAPANLSADCRPFIKHVHNRMLVLNSSCGTELYEKQASGELEFQFSYSGEYELTRVDDNQIFFSFLTSSIDTSEDRITYTRNTNGGWTETTSVNNLTHRWNTTQWSYTYSDYFPVSNSDTVLSRNFGFDTEIAIPTPTRSGDSNPAVLFYQRAPDTGWVLTQEIPITNLPGTRSHRSEDGLFLTYSTLSNRSELEIDSLFRDSSGQWKYLFNTGLDIGWPNDVEMYQNHLFIASDEGLHHLTAPITQYTPDVVSPTETATISADPDCDYSSAYLYGGWGWNERLRESCPPLPDVGSIAPPAVGACVDSDGDGWGWDGVASCRMP